MQTLKNKEVKNQGNWNSFFPNTNKEQLESNNWRQNNFSQSQNWNGECSYVEINQISIPIPSFVSHATKNKLIQAIQEVQQQVDSHPTVSSFKQKFLGKMHTYFLNKNQELFEKINTSLNINKVVDLNPSLQLHIDNQNKLFQQNLNLKKQDDDAKSDSSAIENLIQRYEVINKDFSPLKAEEFKQFVKNIFDKNNEQSNLVFNDIQQYMKNKETKNKLNNNKNPYLLSKEDYMYNKKLIEEILNNIYRFGVDRCKIQKNQNQIIMSETLKINFSERKTLKTITYSILHHSLCKQDQKFAKRYIYKFLAHINPYRKENQQENYILRQIFLHFLQIVIINSDHSKQISEFLDNIFQFEFLSSLLCDYLIFSAKKILKITNHINQNQDLYDIIDQLSKANYFDLYLLSKKQAESKKYSYAQYQSRQIFIYFEQSLQQDQTCPVYYVINPNDQLICLAKNAF